MPIQGDLPEHPVNQLHALNDSTWVVATDAGVFATFNRGVNWEPVGSLPTIPVYDIEADTITNRLIAGTFARSLLSFPLDSLLPRPEIIEPNSVASTESSHDILAYPNPFNSTLTLEFPMEVTSIRITDLSGRVMHSQLPTVPTSAPLILATEAWPEGYYVLLLETAEGVQSKKLMKVM
ncbi:MAG TPA: hypothetical protein DD635_00290 [Flavobacteriales bacterium]|nr:hypothetical protein [Flavobacteriales bacterium]